MRATISGINNKINLLFIYEAQTQTYTNTNTLTLDKIFGKII